MACGAFTHTSPGTSCESPSPSAEPSSASPQEGGWSFCQERGQQQPEHKLLWDGERNEPSSSCLHLQLEDEEVWTSCVGRGRPVLSAVMAAPGQDRKLAEQFSALTPTPNTFTFSQVTHRNNSSKTEAALKLPNTFTHHHQRPAEHSDQCTELSLEHNLVFPTDRMQDFTPSRQAFFLCLIVGTSSHNCPARRTPKVPW